MRKFIYVWCLVIAGVVAQAQNFPVYNSYYMNPYLYNPAEVASEYAWLFVNHRQQWMNVEGAPVLTTVNFNTMLDQTRAGIGIKASSFKRGILNTTEFSFSYAYGVPLNLKNVLYFGLSGGASTNSIDMASGDIVDPAIGNYLSNNIQPVSNFGLLFRSESGLNLGVSLPQLFADKFNSTANFQNTTLSPFDNVIVSAYYKKKVEGKLVSRRRRGVRAKVKTNDSYAPLELYALYKYSKIGVTQFEVMGKLNLSENFWLGASYRQAYGLTGSLGFAINRFVMGYSYEPGNQPAPAFSSGTHEIQLGLRLGEAKQFKRPAPVLRSTLKTTPGQQHSARFNHQDDPEVRQGEPGKKHLIVVKVFSDFAAADALKQKLLEQKYNANVFYYPKDKKYYVHVFETAKSGEAQQELRNLKNYSKLKNVKIVTVTTQ